jgi:hypothetical protein
MPRARPVTPPPEPPPAPSFTLGGFTAKQLLLLVPLLAVAAALTLSYLWNEDFFWYLSSGEYLLEHGRVPDQDPFLYTAEKGIGWVYHSWLWTVLVAAIARLAGLEGVVVFHALLALGLSVLVYTTRPVDRLGLVNALALLLFLVTVGQRLCGKAEVATWLLLAVFYRVLEKDGAFTWKRGAALGALQVLWANLHGGYPLGVFIALCYGAGGWIETRFGARPAGAPAGRSRYPPLWFPALLFLLAVADPRLFRERLAPFAFVAGSEAVQPIGESGGNVILEWQSPFRAAAAAPSLPWLYVLAVAAGLGSFVLARRWPASRLLFFAGLAALGATAVRHLPGVGLAAALVLLGNLGERWHQPSAVRRKARRGQAGRSAPAKWAAVAAGGLLALALLGAAVALRLARPGFDAGQARSFFTVKPAIACPQAAGFILDRGLPGPIFNDFQLGAYLGHRLYPRHRLFIDGRVLDPALVVRYTRMVESPALWRQAERRYGFRTVVLGTFSKTLRSPLGRAVQEDPRWRLVYLDPLAAIFTRGGSAPPTLRLELPGPRRVPFVDPPGFVPPLPALQRLFLRDTPSKYLVEYLAALGHLGRTREVIALATEALRAMPEHPLVHRQRCAAHLAERNGQAALADCEVAYRGRPDDSQVVALYAMALSGTGRGQEALFVVDEALRRPQPDDTLRRLRQSLIGGSGAR